MIQEVENIQREGYISELNNKNDVFESLFTEDGGRRITLLYSACDTEHKQAAVIKEYIEKYYQ